jgi:uncharacterized protein (TIRG00374 family)
LLRPEAEGSGLTPRRIATSLAGLILAVGLLWWALRGVHLDDVLHHIRSARPWPLFAAVVLATLTFPLRLVRWRLLLRYEDGRTIPPAPLWHAVAIGFMANNLLPFRAGELVRLLVATRLAGVRFSAALSSLAVERIFDGLTVLGLMGLALLASDLPPDVAIGGVPVAHAAQVAGAMVTVALLGAILVVAFPLAAERLVRRVLPAGAFADRVVRLIEGIRQGLSALRSPALLAGVVLWSLVLWFVNAYAFYAGFKAFGISVDLLGAFLLQGILVLGISVQLTPGYVGQFEAAIVAALALYGVPNDLASSYAIAFHGASFLPIVLLGAWSLARTPVALADLRRPSG